MQDGSGESMAIAARLARAYTGKDKILFCGYHGWHDWYLAANLNSEEFKFSTSSRFRTTWRSKRFKKYNYSI